MRLFFRFFAACFVLAPAIAFAHGRFPGTTAIVFDPTAPSHMLVRTTFGLIETPDRSNWRWICSEGTGASTCSQGGQVGYNANVLDPPIVFSGGSALIGTFNGLAQSQPEDLCRFSLIGGDLACHYFVDVRAVPGNPDRVLALSSDGGKVMGDGDAFITGLWETNDGAKSWHPYGVAPPPEAHFLATALVIAPKAGPNGDRVYLSGRDGTMVQGYHGVVLRSDDSGKSWQRSAFADSDGVNLLPYLQAVDPNDADVVYLANTHYEQQKPGDQADYRSPDGGMSWQRYFSVSMTSTAIPLPNGFALSPDGKRLAVGIDKSGLLIADATVDKPVPVQVSGIHVGCLNWQPEGLYACANQYSDLFAVGLSKDGGKSWQALVHITTMDYAKTHAPVAPLMCDVIACDPGTSVGQQCPQQWPSEADQLSLPQSCNDAGSGGGDSSGAGAAGEITANTGCGCELGAGPRPALASLLALAFALARTLRRRRR